MVCGGAAGIGDYRQLPVRLGLPVFTNCSGGEGGASRIAVCVPKCSWIGGGRRSVVGLGEGAEVLVYFGCVGWVGSIGPNG